MKRPTAAGIAPRVPRLRLAGFWLSLATFLVIYLFLRFGFGYVSQVIVGADHPLPIPSRLLSMYVALVALGMLVQVAVDDQRLREFRDPLIALIRGDPSRKEPTYRVGRLVCLALPPILVGYAVYNQLAPKIASAATARQQHPTLPAEYAELANPYRTKPEAEQQKAVAEGIVLYEKNCRPCHGTPADGKGPMAHGFRPRPIAFTSPGTIDTIIESYPVWRIEAGGIGLPNESTPWNSAMPPWQGELERDDIWKIIMAEYHIAGKAPRVPEGAE